jgi:hypothetical protein
LGNALGLRLPRQGDIGNKYVQAAVLRRVNMATGRVYLLYA